MAVAAHIARLRGSTPRPRPGAEAGRTPCLRGCGQEELPHVQGQGQRPRVPGCDSAGTAEKSYPTSEVRGSCRECQAATAQEQPRQGIKYAMCKSLFVDPDNAINIWKIHDPEVDSNRAGVKGIIKFGR